LNEGLTPRPPLPRAFRPGPEDSWERGSRTTEARGRKRVTASITSFASQSRNSGVRHHNRATVCRCALSQAACDPRSHRWAGLRVAVVRERGKRPLCGLRGDAVLGGCRKSLRQRGDCGAVEKGIWGRLMAPAARLDVAYSGHAARGRAFLNSPTVLLSGSNRATARCSPLSQAAVFAARERGRG